MSANPQTKSRFASVPDFSVPLGRTPTSDEPRTLWVAGLRLKFITAAVLGLPIYDTRRLLRTLAR